MPVDVAGYIDSNNNNNGNMKMCFFIITFKVLVNRLCKDRKKKRMRILFNCF